MNFKLFSVCCCSWSLVWNYGALETRFICVALERWLVA